MGELALFLAGLAWTCCGAGDDGVARNYLRPIGNDDPVAKAVALASEGEDGVAVGGEYFVRNWVVAGPFSLADRKYRSAEIQDAIDDPIVEREANLMPGVGAPGGKEWKVLEAGVTGSGVVDLIAVYGKMNRAAAYLGARLYSEMDVGNYVLECGSDDYVKIWLNGREIHKFNRGTRSVGEETDKIPNVALRKGWNELVAKVVNYEGGWGLALRLTTADGRPVSTCRIAAQTGTAVRLPAAESSRLLAALEGTDIRQRIEAAQKLADAGEAGKDAVPTLARMALDTKDYAARVAACKALASIAPASKDVADALVSSFNEKTDAARRARPDIAEYLARCAPEQILPGLAGALHGVDEDARMDALRVLCQMGEQARSAIPDIQEATKGKLGFTRRLAVEALAKCGADDAEAQKSLLAMMTDEKPLVRLEVVRRIGETKLAVPLVAGVYVNLLGDPDERVRMAAAYAISLLPSVDAAPAVAALRAADPLKRAAAARAIGLSATPPKNGPETVAGALKDSDADVRASAAQALAWMGGPAAVGAYDTLLSLRKETDPWVRSAAVAALRHGGEKAVPLLAESLGDEDYKVRREAAAALSAMKGTAIHAMADLLSSPSADLRWRSMEVLGRMGSAATETAAACLQDMDDKAWFVRREAVRTLKAIAPKDKDVVARFREAVAKDEEWTVRKEAFDALKEWNAEKGLTVRPY